MEASKIRKMALINLFAGQQRRHRLRELAGADPVREGEGKPN